MVEFPKQSSKGSCLRQESQGVIKLLFKNWPNYKPPLLKTALELEVCISLGSMPHRRGALLVKEMRPANDTGWNGLKSRCCHPRVPCWCSWKLSFCRSNARADCWWQRRMVVTRCRDRRWVKWVSVKLISYQLLDVIVRLNTCHASNGLSPERQKSILLTSGYERDGCWSSILQIWLNHWDEKLICLLAIGRGQLPVRTTKSTEFAVDFLADWVRWPGKAVVNDNPWKTSLRNESKIGRRLLIKFRQPRCDHFSTDFYTMVPLEKFKVSSWANRR